MRAVALCMLLCLAACAPAAEPMPPQTLWGRAVRVASAPYAHAPALLVEGGRVWWAWSGVDGTPRHYASITPQSVPVILALNAFYPFDYALFPALEGKTHWLWLDRHAESGELRLLFALVNGDAVAELGINVLSSAPTSHYSALAVGEGRVRVVWSEGSLGARALFTRVLDGRGRASLPQLLTRSADYPALLQERDGTLWLFWQGEGQLWRARLDDEGLAQVTRLGLAPALAWGDSLESLSAAHDDTHTYLFWQLERADGTPALLWSAYSHGAAHVPPPMPLAAVLEEADTPLATGFNGGRVQAARLGGQAVGWAQALPQQTAVVPMVATQDDKLLMLYWHGGTLVGGQTLATVGRLLRPPRLASDPQQHLYVAWSQPYDATTAHLYSISTR